MIKTQCHSLASTSEKIMPGLKTQVASKNSSGGALNLLGLEENFNLWKDKSMDVQSLLTSRILQHFASTLILRTASVTPSGTALFSFILSKLFCVLQLHHA